MPKRKDEMEAVLDEELEASFPASDPLSSNAGERIGEPKRNPAGKAAPKPRRPRR